MYAGRLLTSSYIREMYCPNSPNEKSCTPAKKVRTMIVVDKPGVRFTPTIFCNKYQKPIKKLINETKAPINETILNGFDENPISPLSPIFNEPRKRL